MRELGANGVAALAEAGLEHGNGPLLVNERMETAVLGLYAASDVVGGWLLAHVAFAEGIVAAENTAGMESRMDYQVVPRRLQHGSILIRTQEEILARVFADEGKEKCQALLEKTTCLEEIMGHQVKVEQVA